jgi:DNA-binding CsgD family transcriptional regulator
MERKQTNRKRNEFGLTPRHMDVVKMLPYGWSQRDMARDLGVSVHTIKHHLTEIYDITGTESHRHLLVWAIQHGVVSVEVPGCCAVAGSSRYAGESGD